MLKSAGMVGYRSGLAALLYTQLIRGFKSHPDYNDEGGSKHWIQSYLSLSKFAGETKTPPRKGNAELRR